MKTKNKLFIVLIVLLVVSLACSTNYPWTIATEADEPEVAATATQENGLTNTSAPAKTPVPTNTHEATMLPTQEPTEAPTLSPTATPDPDVVWVAIKGSHIYAKALPVVEDGQTMLLPLETNLITDLSNGRYEGREPVGSEHGDWPPHMYLVSWEVPMEYLSCVSVTMDISWRFFGSHNCPSTVPFRVTIANNYTKYEDGEVVGEWTVEEVDDTYLTLGSGDRVGIFVGSFYGEDMITIQSDDQAFDVSYGCYDCLAHTAGDPANFIILNDDSITHVGPDTEPLQESALEAGVFPMPMPSEDEDFSLTFVIELDPTEEFVLWAGQYVPKQP